MEQQPQQSTSNYAYPDKLMETEKQIASIAVLLKESTNLLPVLRREFRGEALQQYGDGTYAYVQMSKPMFVKTDPESEKPIMKEAIYKDDDGNPYKKQIFIPNDEAIEEMLSMLKCMGLNQITLLTNISEDTILDDLKEFECKLAAVLALKQKEWGMDKELLPIVMSKIKTLVQDARYQAREGHTIKAIQKTVQRIETFQEGVKTKVKSPYS